MDDLTKLQKPVHQTIIYCNHSMNCSKPPLPHCHKPTNHLEIYGWPKTEKPVELGTVSATKELGWINGDTNWLGGQSHQWPTLPVPVWPCYSPVRQRRCHTPASSLHACWSVPAKTIELDYNSYAWWWFSHNPNWLHPVYMYMSYRWLDQLKIWKFCQIILRIS